MERKKQMNLPGLGQVTVTEVGYRAVSENWNEYFADDGSVIRIKVVVTEVLRVDDRYDDQGDPVYVVKSANVTAVSAADEVRKQND